MKIIQPSDATQQRVLPKYDFPTRMVNATPGVNRIMNYELEEVDGSSKIKIVEDDTLVFNRPKFFVRSSGTVWTSEYMRLGYEEPRLFLTDIDEAQPTPEVALLIRIIDQLRFYVLATNKDVANISNEVDCPHRMYEICRAMAVKKTLMKVQEQNIHEKFPTDEVEDINASIGVLF